MKKVNPWPLSCNEKIQPNKRFLKYGILIILTPGCHHVKIIISGKSALLRSVVFGLNLKKFSAN